MKHFLATRFNLPAEGWKVSRNGQKVLTDSWLKHRFEIFEKYCLPSVKNQTNQEFIWCVFFDTKTPQKYKEKIEVISNSFNKLKPIFIDKYEKSLPSLKEFIASNLESKDDYVITSGIDNDDLIHREYIHTIQRLFKPADEMVIDLRLGYQVSIEGGVVSIRLKTNYFNPFISVVEKSVKPNTVFSKAHFEWSDSASIVVFDDKELWIELVHERNKYNFVDSSGSVVETVLDDTFCFSCIR